MVCDVMAVLNRRRAGSDDQPRGDEHSLEHVPAFGRCCARLAFLKEGTERCAPRSWSDHDDRHIVRRQAEVDVLLHVDRDGRAKAKPVGNLGGGDSAARRTVKLVADRSYGDMRFFTNDRLARCQRIESRLQGPEPSAQTPGIYSGNGKPLHNVNYTMTGEEPNT